jgi:MFS family permease
MAVGPLGMMLAANLGGRITGRIGPNHLAFAAMIMVTLGLAWISLWNDTTGHVLLALALLLHGAGLGLFQAVNLEIVAATLPKTNRGVAGSLTLVMRTIGVVMAASLLTMAFAGIEQDAAAAGGDDAFAVAFRSVFQLAALGLAGFVLISLLRPSLWRQSGG